MVGIEGECGRIAIVAEKTVVVLMRLSPQPSGDGEVDITEFDITESDVTFFQEIDITESDVTKKGN